MLDATLHNALLRQQSARFRYHKSGGNRGSFTNSNKSIKSNRSHVTISPLQLDGNSEIRTKVGTIKYRHMSNDCNKKLKSPQTIPSSDDDDDDSGNIDDVKEQEKIPNH